MRKVICFLLALVMVLALCACADKPKESEQQTPAPTESQTPAPTEPTSAPTEPTTAPTEPSSEENPVAMEHVPENHTKVTADTLIGSWEITGWINDYLGDGSFSPVEDQQFIYTGENLDYVIAGALSSSRPYVLEHEYNVVINPDSEPLTWTTYFNADGKLCQYDPRYGITYVCVRRTFANIGAVGCWQITGWINDYLGDGSFSPLDPATLSVYTLDENNHLAYRVAGVEQSANDVVFLDNQTIKLSDELNWGIWFAEDGKLMIYDTRFPITYVCVPFGFEELGVVGKWEITGWTNPDGSFAPLDPGTQYFIMDENDHLSYVVAGTEQSSNDVFFTDEGTMWLNEELYWPVAMGEDGKLLITDTRFGIVYVCEKAGDEFEADPVSDADISGCWSARLFTYGPAYTVSDWSYFDAETRSNEIEWELGETKITDITIEPNFDASLAGSVFVIRVTKVAFTDAEGNVKKLADAATYEYTAGTTPAIQVMPAGEELTGGTVTVRFVIVEKK